MKFCNFCENMMYISIDPDNNDLIHYCKNCDNKIIQKKEDGSILIIDDNQVDDIIKYSQYINKNIKFDPTLPHVNNIKCNKCNPKENDVIYIKYDFINMKYLYFCCNCDTFWKADS